jgi:hypothetical protein
MWPAKIIRRISSGKHLYQIHKWSLRVWNCCSPTSLPYCALYNYAHGSVGYGCAEYSGYTTTVLLEPITTAIGTLIVTTSSLNSTSQTILTTSTNNSPTTNAPTASPTPPVSNGLKPGAIAGIAIGGVVAVAAICYLIFLVWFHKYKNSQAARQSYIGSIASSRTAHPPGDYSGTKFDFPSPQPPPWEWSSTSPGIAEMVGKIVQYISI